MSDAQGAMDSLPDLAMTTDDRVPAADVKLKRANAPAPCDGRRVLVDRLWPRSVAKAEAALNAWDKEVSPSPALRQWFGRDPARWAIFRSRYAAELRCGSEPVRRLRAEARKGTITLVYAAHDRAHIHASVLRDILLGRFIPSPEGGAANEETPDAP
jgi:uncharacterized protein YeaO (DUF488 family)